MKKDDGGQAFPMFFEHSDVGPQVVPGMTLRDYFAANIMQGRAAIPGMIHPDADAHEAYKVADAMIAERNK